MLLDTKSKDGNGYSLLNPDHHLRPISRERDGVCFWIQANQPWTVLGFIQVAHYKSVTSHLRERFQLPIGSFEDNFYFHALILGNNICCHAHTWLSKTRALCPFNLLLDFSTFSTERL